MKSNLFTEDDFAFPAPFHFQTLEQVSKMFAVIANTKTEELQNELNTCKSRIIELESRLYKEKYEGLK